MTNLRSLPEDARLFDVFRAYPVAARPLLRLHSALLRGPSPLTVAERELIAAYVSGLNACGYCHGIHGAVAASFGIPENELTTLLDDPETADVDPRMRPLLRYVRTLTLTPDRVPPTEAEAVLEAGWNEQALHDAVAVCALFNMMNRYVAGLDVTATTAYTTTSADRLVEIGYDGLLALLDEGE